LRRSEQWFLFIYYAIAGNIVDNVFNLLSSPCDWKSARRGWSILNIYRGLSCLCHGGIKQCHDPSVRLSVPWHSCLGCRHTGCLQLSHCWPPETCGLWTRPRTDVDSPRFVQPSNCRRRGHIISLLPERCVVLIRNIVGCAVVNAGRSFNTALCIDCSMSSSPVLLMLNARYAVS